MQPKYWRSLPLGVRGGDGLEGRGVGAGIGAIGVATEDCRGIDSMCGAGMNVLGVATFAALGAGVGALFAAVTPEKSILVYELKTGSSSARFGVSPVVTPGRQGVMLTIRF